MQLKNVKLIIGDKEFPVGDVEVKGAAQEVVRYNPIVMARGEIVRSNGVFAGRPMATSFTMSCAPSSEMAEEDMP